MNKLLNKLKNASKVPAQTISESNFFNERELVSTDIPALNIALGGSIHSGISPGLLIVAGPSKTFKTMMSLFMVSAYMKKYSDAVCLYYDSEFGSSPDYLSKFGIDLERILHIPIEHLEQLKFDMVKRLEEISRGDKVIIFIDSIGNVASKKEVEDAQDEKSVADMSRAKSMKSLFRIITPHLTLKDIPCIAINHTYMEQCLEENVEVVMFDYTTKPIKDIQVGEYVMTRFGPQEVLETYDNEYLNDYHGDYDMYEFELSDGTNIQCTGTHKFLINNVWVMAQDINDGDELMLCN